MDLATFQMAFTFTMIAIAILFMAIERFRLEVTSLSIIAAFLVFFEFFPVSGPGGRNLLGPEQLLSGLANPSLIAILAFLVIGQGLYHTGALEGMTRTLTSLGGKRSWLTLGLALLAAGVISAFMNNTPIVVMFLPIVAAISARLQMSPSKTLMPLSFIAILGGMTTLIGSSTNLLVADVAEKMAMVRIGFFEFTGIGLILAGAGSVYVLAIMPYLLKPRATMAEEVAGQSGRQFIAQIDVTFDHPLNGAKSVAGMFPELKDMTVRMIQRGEQSLLPPFEDVSLRPGDSIIVAATRAVLTEALKARESIISTDTPENSDGEQTPIAARLMLAEAVIAPGSRMIGRTVEQSGLHAETGCIILGVQRRSRMIRMKLTEIRLEAGDVILILGSRPGVQGLRSNRDLLLLEWSATELPKMQLANRALTIFALVVLAAASGVVPIVTAALVGAMAMVPLGCLNIRQAARAFDQRIYLLIGASLAMAAALEATGGAAFLANGVVQLFAGASPTILLSAMFGLIALMTNILSNNATAVLFAPIALNTAEQLNVDPIIFLVAVILAANCSFATPIAYQTNLLVMGPGHYRFSDFVKAGLPLVLFIWLLFTLVAPWYYGL